MNGDLDDRDLMAAEYVLGTLDAADRQRAEARLAQEPAFARQVEAWADRLAPLATLAQPMEPSAEVGARIRQAIADRQPAQERPGPALVPPPPARARGVAPFWRWWALAASAAAAALALYVAVAPAPPAGGRYVAVLNRGEAAPSWLVSVDVEAQTLTIRPLAEVAVPDKSLELWMVPGTGDAPRSLGLLEPDAEVLVPISATVEEQIPSAAALAVSLEPVGGSPTGQPTGPVLYQGPVLPIGD